MGEPKNKVKKVYEETVTCDKSRGGHHLGFLKFQIFNGPTHYEGAKFRDSFSLTVFI